MGVILPPAGFAGPAGVALVMMAFEKAPEKMERNHPVGESGTASLPSN